jgi:hypothetical protein
VFACVLSACFLATDPGFAVPYLFRLASPSDTTSSRADSLIAKDRPTYRVTRATSQVSVDGVLDEQAWKDALTLDMPYEVDPGENIPAPVRTDFMITYDDSYLLVAFRALDPDPTSIRARVADRDTPFSDDFVGIIFDPFNDERRGFELFVNPLGVQMDLSRNEVGNNGQEDETWDAIWESAGRIDAEGYIVEMAVPFSSLRFPRTQGPQTWGIFPFRAYPRVVRHQLGLTPSDRDLNCFFCQMAKFTGFEGISPGRNIELTPTLTTIRTDTLSNSPGHSLVSGDPDGELGLSAHWGLTPNLIANGALNPDFSQVEADVAQLELNTQFALFYPEKRPFFLEGADFFDTPIQAIYTRTVADPDWGAKITGKEGRSALGVYTARDNVTNLLFPSNQGSDDTSLDQDVTASVFRYRHDVGRNSILGGLFTSREGEGYYNRVYGADGHFRFTSRDGLRVQALGSHTAYPEEVTDDEDLDQPAGSLTGHAVRAYYLHESRNWYWWALYSEYAPDFRADAGFIPRVDTRSGIVGLERVVWGEKGDPYTRLNFGFEADATNDFEGTLTNQDFTLYALYFGPLQTFANLDYTRKKEYFDGTRYEMDTGELVIENQPTGNLSVWFGSEFGDAIDYDNSRPATRIWGGPGFRYYFGRHFQVWFDTTYEQLNVDGGRLFQALLLQTTLVYQFNPRTFVRAIAQHLEIKRNRELYDEPEDFEARSESLFTQFLFSYKINPQTVLFLGYSDNYDNEERSAVIRTDRTFFMKIGYAWLV